ncbi:octanoyltransferase [Iodidimonas gelatinilytica]|uniref:Octanoyltransferase n=2 Tax=Iodidimonas gelatinilytica TaxID=1236966 RepID=A0A5A7MQB0_9PROT|nr:octanoyltransferase [Iodidimonas gelatinilytica]GER00620.1 octanoyltransferase [Iodidimonas gelatinilytica]
MVSTKIEWRSDTGLVPYPDALAAMEDRVAAIRAGSAPEQVWLLEHPPLYTAGTSARESDLLAPKRFPVYQAGRGGQYTYHGPGQRIAYVMLDLKQRGADLRRYIKDLEHWIIDSLAEFDVQGDVREGRVGVWVTRPDGREEKIAAIGVRVRRWVSFHGISLNVSPDLAHFSGIVPCGITEHGVTSLHALGVKASMEDMDNALQHHFHRIFPPIS